MRTICLKSRRRFATLSVDGKRADVLDLFATRSLLKYIVRVYLIGNISSASSSTCDLSSPRAIRSRQGEGKKKCVREIFSFGENHSRFGANQTL